MLCLILSTLTKIHLLQYVDCLKGIPVGSPANFPNDCAKTYFTAWSIPWLSVWLILKWLGIHPSFFPHIRLGCWGHSSRRKTWRISRHFQVKQNMGSSNMFLVSPWICSCKPLENFQSEAHRRQPDQMPEPPQLNPFDMQKHCLYLHSQRMMKLLTVSPSMSTTNLQRNLISSCIWIL